MQKVSLPPLGGAIQVNVAAKEPPHRSWSRFKKVLIDNPKDSNLLQRQKLWNFQKLNRGAFRSQLASLPDIPYRVHTNTVEKVNAAVQADSAEQFIPGIRILYPTVFPRRDKTHDLDSDDSDDDDGNFRSDQRHKACSPIQLNADSHAVYSDDFEEDVDDPDLDFDTVVKKQNTGTMTETKKMSAKVSNKTEQRQKSVKPKTSARDKTKLPILKLPEETPRTRTASEKKTVKFESKEEQEVDTRKPSPVRKEKPLSPETPPDDVKDNPVPALQLNIPDDSGPISRPSSSSSDDSSDDVINIPSDKMGHSSHLSLDNLSILDLLSGSRTDRSRTVNKWYPLTSRDDRSRRHGGDENEANRLWFKQIVGDKEVIDTGTYDNFARTRPCADTYLDSTDSYSDMNKISARKSIDPKMYDEFPTYRQVLSKNSQAKPSTTSTPISSKGKNNKRSSVNSGKA